MIIICESTLAVSVPQNLLNIFFERSYANGADPLKMQQKRGM